MNCSHKSCGSKEKVWLPYKDREVEHGLKVHSYCIHCGAVKNISGDTPKRIGYYINILSGIRKKYGISEAQIRLVINELNRTDGFEDSYWTTGFAQEKIFLGLMKKYCSLPENTILSLL